MFSRLPPVTQALLVANGVLFLLQLLLGQRTFDPFMLWPLGGFDPFSPGQNFQPWQLLTTVSCTAASATCCSTCWPCTCSARRWN
jgi:membrane associated rhomboid family serine protease